MKYLIFISLCLMIVQCKPDHGAKEVEVLYDQVIEIHDEVMPKMSDISKLKRRIKKVDTQDESTLSLIKELEDADEAMMVWMSDFQKYKTLGDSSKQAKMLYLEKEKIKISQVSDQMMLSIYSAQKFLNE